MLTGTLGAIAATMQSLVGTASEMRSPAGSSSAGDGLLAAAGKAGSSRVTILSVPSSDMAPTLPSG